ncbi:MAG: LysR family transcriptional regulator [Oliverpabstia sp.]
MDTKLIEYIIAIDKHKSISGAAEELYLTQSALNQQLLKLERELEAPLFIRTRNHWELTDVGKLYVERAKQILSIKNETYNQIQDMAKRWKNTVTIGLTPERGIQMFTAVYPQIHDRYPNVVFQPVEATVDSQVRMMENNTLDIGFQTIRERKYKHLVYDHIFMEPFYLCIPRSHPLAYSAELSPEQYPEIPLSNFRDDLFTLVKRSSGMRKVIDDMFEASGFKPKLLFESTHMRTMQKLTSNGQCCSIIPRTYAIPDKRVAYYSLGPDASWEVAAVHAQNHYLNNAAKDFIQMASDYWKTHLYID